MSPAPKRYCVHGHDTWETGRYPSGTCRVCNNRHKFEYRVRVNGGLPAHRLREHLRVSRWSDTELRRLYADRWDVPLGAANKALWRLMRVDHIPEESADRWCVTVGTHLSLIYPELYAVGETA